MKPPSSSAPRVAAFLAVAGMTLGACLGFDFVAPGGQSVRPSLGLYLDARQDSVSEFFLHASLGADPGLIEDSTLVLNGQSLAATPVNGLLRWGSTISGNPLPDTLHLLLPRAVGQAARFALDIPTSHSDSSYRMTLRTGDALHLHVTAGDSLPGYERSYSMWQLEVTRRSCGSSSSDDVVLRGPGPYPTDFAIPWVMLQPIAGTLRLACFSWHTSEVLLASPYDVYVSRSLRIEWQIVVKP